MAFMVSPGVNVSEVDLTTRVPIPSTSVGAFSGLFKWGPINEIVSVVDDNDLVAKFGKTDQYTYPSVMTAASFLSYSNNLQVVRAANTSLAKNSSTSGTGILVENDDDYEKNFESTGSDGINFCAKYPGSIGNSLKVSMCLPDRANTEISADGSVTLAANTKVALTGLFDADPDVTLFEGTGGNDVANELRVGDVIEIHGGNVGVVTNVASNTNFTAVKYDPNNAGNVEINLFEESSVAANTIIRYARSAFEESETIFGTISIPSNSKSVIGSKTFFQYQISVGDILRFTDSQGVDVARKVESIESNFALTLVEPVDNSVSAASFSREWEYRSSFENAPLTSAFAAKETGNKDILDEIHLIVLDEDGLITGTPDKRGFGTKSSVSVLERYPNLSVASNAVGENGNSVYYKEIINRNSQFVRWLDHDSTGDGIVFGSSTLSNSWGSQLSFGETKPFNGSYSLNLGGNIGSARFNATNSLSGGDDGNSSASDADRIAGFNFFKNPENIDVSLVMTGEVSEIVQTYVINNICEYRKDCVAFVSPTYSDVSTRGSEVNNIVTKRSKLPSSSYAVMDGNFKYAFDRFSSVNRYIPLNGDLAGLCAQSDNQNPFISPAGFNRGNIRNVTKLAYNPTLADRDKLYGAGINPVISLPGGGTILFGDKTLLSKPSAFDRINVRRLFIILEKAIANAAQFSLFEFNDEFTRASFVSLVEPFLRDVQGRRGITDYRIVCDATNNPPVVVDRNEFRGDIFIKPSRSINFINLNFVAVSTGVEFSEVINAI